MIHVINTFDISERLACRLVRPSRSAFCRQLRADNPDDPDREYLDARNDGSQVNHKRIQRLWAEEGLRVVVKRHRKRISVSTVPSVVAEKGNDVWSIDFQFDSTITGKPVKVLSIVDEHTRECLGGLVDYSIIGLGLAEQLDVLALERGMPRALRMDNGPALISKALAEWATETERIFIPPGQPWRNGFIESFNGKIRDECLGVNQTSSLNHAKGTIGLWKKEYNTIRSHSSLRHSTPNVYADQCTHQKTGDDSHTVWTENSGRVGCAQINGP